MYSCMILVQDKGDGGSLVGVDEVDFWDLQEGL